MILCINDPQMSMIITKTNEYRIINLKMLRITS